MRILFLVTSALLTPMVTLAATPTDFKSLVSLFLDLIGLLVPVLFALAFLAFLWGLTRALIIGGGDETSIEKGKQIALAGIIGLVVMSGVWGIVALISRGLFGF